MPTGFAVRINIVGLTPVDGLFISLMFGLFVGTSACSSDGAREAAARLLVVSGVFRLSTVCLEGEPEGRSAKGIASATVGLVGLIGVVKIGTFVENVDGTRVRGHFDELDEGPIRGDGEGRNVGFMAGISVDANLDGLDEGPIRGDDEGRDAGFVKGMSVEVDMDGLDVCAY